MITQLREEKKQKDIEYDEVVGIKIQLAQEIELYRRILSDAEKCAGYMSPLASTRKKRKLNKLSNEFNNTPGIVRGAQLARKDLDRLETITNDGSDIDNNNNDINQENNHSKNNDTKTKTTKNKKNKNKNKNKSRKRGRRHIDEPENQSQQQEQQMEQEEEIVNQQNYNNNNNNNNNENRYYDEEDDVFYDGDQKDMESSDMVTPGEAYPLQFSTMDLTKSMIEIQNISDQQISLSGYTLSNSDGSAQYPLPHDRMLLPNEKLKVKIGLRAKPTGDHDCILWKADVWSGDEQDIARLYDPNDSEIARIEIHPDMIPEKVKGGCSIM